MIRQLTLKITIFANDGDSFTFLAPKADKTYVFTVDPLYAGSSITIRKGDTRLAWNATGQPYAKAVCGSDPVQIEVSETEGPFNIWVTESWWGLVDYMPKPWEWIPYIRKGQNPNAEGAE